MNYYDGTGFLVKKSMNVKSAKEMDGATICVQPGTSTELADQPTISASTTLSSRRS